MDIYCHFAPSELLNHYLDALSIFCEFCSDEYGPKRLAFRTLSSDDGGEYYNKQSENICFLQLIGRKETPL